MAQSIEFVAGTQLPADILELLNQSPSLAAILDGSENPPDQSEIEILAQMEMHEVPFKLTLCKQEARRRHGTRIDFKVRQGISRVHCKNTWLFCANDLMPFRHKHRDEACYEIPKYCSESSIVRIQPESNGGKELLFVSYVGLHTLLCAPTEKRPSRGRPLAATPFTDIIRPTLEKNLQYWYSNSKHISWAINQIGATNDELQALQASHAAHLGSLEAQLNDHRTKTADLQASLENVSAAHQKLQQFNHKITKKRKILEDTVLQVPTIMNAVAADIVVTANTSRNEWKPSEEHRRMYSQSFDDALRHVGVQTMRYLIHQFGDAKVDNAVRETLKHIIVSFTQDEDLEAIAGDIVSTVHTFRNEVRLMVPIRRSIKRVWHTDSSVALSAKSMLEFLVNVNQFIRASKDAELTPVFAEGALRIRLQGALADSQVDVADVLEKAYIMGGSPFKPVHKSRNADIRHWFHP
jgi:hypothetical protein